MSLETEVRTPYEIIEQEKEAYLEALPEPDPDWPPDVRIIYETLQDRLFELGLRAQDVVEDCGIGDHNIYTRFHHFTGHGIKELALVHRLRLAKRLLEWEDVPIGRIALSVGYENPSGFSETFRRHEGCPPSAFRDFEEE